MTTLEIRFCVTCAKTEEDVRLERCSVCSRFFCGDCSHRALGGRKVCSPECARAYYFHGEADDNEDTGSEE